MIPNVFNTKRYQKVFGTWPTMGATTLTLCPARGQPAPPAPSKTKSSGAVLRFNIFLRREKKKKKKFFWQILNLLKYSNPRYKPGYVLQYMGAAPLPVLTPSLTRLPISHLFTPRFSRLHAVFKVNSLNSATASGLRAGADG